MKKINIVSLVIIVIMLSSCVKPPKLDKFIEIKPNETAFVIPLAGNLNKQAKFDSEDQLQKLQVAAKRIKVPQLFKSVLLQVEPL